MELSRHCGIAKDLLSLKRFSNPTGSLEAWERLFVAKGLKETCGIEQYPGFGVEKIYKARVVPLGENIGKSKGYRLIFRLVGEGLYQILVFSRHGLYSNERDLVRIIKDRL